MNKAGLASFLLNKYGQTLSSATRNGIDVTVALVRNDFKAWLMFYTNKQDDPHAMAGTDGELAIKCGALSKMLIKIPVFFQPSLINEPGWVGVLISDKNERTIKDLIDSAWRSQGRGATPIKYVNLTDQDDQSDDYQPEFITGRPAAFANKSKVVLPLQLRKMKEAYNYQVPLAHRQEVNFYRQGQMVSDYVDDYEGFAELYRQTPDYHGLTNEQLRTYFALRSKWRQGKYPRFQHGMDGYLTLYMSELVNLIGCESPGQAFDYLRKFQRHYQRHFLPGTRTEEFPRDMVRYYGLDHKRAAKVFQGELAQDKKLHIVLNPDNYSAAELFAVFAGVTKDYQTARLYKDNPQRFQDVFQLIWQRLLAKKQESNYDYVGQYLTALPISNGGTLFEGLVFDDRLRDDRVYRLDSLRTYRIAGRFYSSNELTPWLPNKAALKKLFREIDRATRIAFRMGRPLKERPVDPPVKAAIKEGLGDYQRQQQEAKLERVPIHLDHLDKIRDDAAVTQEQLLTAEEVDDQPVIEEISPSKDEESIPPVPQTGDDGDELPDLTADEWFFLKALVNHQPYEEYLKKHFLMASLVADEINDKLLDEIGDTVIEFDDHDQPQIVVDYLTDIQDLLKKKEE